MRKHGGGPASHSLIGTTQEDSDSSSVQSNTSDHTTVSRTYRRPGCSRISTESCLLLLWFLHALRIQAVDFGILLALISLFPHSLLPAALYAMSLLLGTGIIAPSVGHLVDSCGRLSSAIIVVVVELVGIALTGTAALLLTAWEQVDTHDHHNPFTYWESSSAFVALLVFTVPISIGAVGINITVEKDWAPTLFTSAYLPTINARLGRLALLAEALGPLIAGSLLQFTKVEYGLATIIGAAIASGLCEILLLVAVYFLQRGLLSGPYYSGIRGYGESPPTSIFFTPATTPVSTVTKKEYAGPSSSPSRGWCSFFAFGTLSYLFPFLNFFRAFPIFFKQRAILFPILAYTALWFSVLSDNSVLLLVFLRAKGFSDIMLSAVRGAGAVFGGITSFAWPYCVKYLGLMWSMRISVVVNVIMVALSAVFFHLGYGGMEEVWGNWLFVSLLVAAKAFSTGFAFGQIQIMQMGVIESQRGIINSFESGLVSSSALGILLLGAILHSTKQFFYLVWVSVGCVFLGGCIFVLWSCCDRRSVQKILLRPGAKVWANETREVERYAFISSHAGSISNYSGEESERASSCSSQECGYTEGDGSRPTETREVLSLDTADSEQEHAEPSPPVYTRTSQRPRSFYL